MGRCALAPRLHRGAGLLISVSDQMNGRKVALESVSAGQDSIKAQITDNFGVPPIGRDPFRGDPFEVQCALCQCGEELVTRCAVKYRA